MSAPTASEPLTAAPLADRPVSRARRWRRTAGAWLGAASFYWLVLFVSTHLPTKDLPGDLLEFDKLLHAGAYFVLTTVLLIAWRRTGARPGLRGRLLAASLVLAYGVIDELTQPLVGRQCDLVDWCADAVGVFAAVAVDQFRRHS